MRRNANFYTREFSWFKGWGEMVITPALLLADAIQCSRGNHGFLGNSSFRLRTQSQPQIGTGIPLLSAENWARLDVHNPRWVWKCETSLMIQPRARGIFFHQNTYVICNISFFPSQLLHMKPRKKHEALGGTPVIYSGLVINQWFRSLECGPFRIKRNVEGSFYELCSLTQFNHSWWRHRRIQ